MSANMNYQQAFDLLVNKVYAPVFFQKLASDFGIQPTSADEAQEFLALAGKLQQLHEAEQVKQANDRVSLVSAASRSLDQILSGAGVNVSRSPAQLAQDEEVKSAAAELAQYQELRDAALLYQDAMNQSVV